jgi:hypothetical protein
MRFTGRLFQLVGLCLLPLAVFLELTNKLDRGEFGLSEMLVMMVFGWGVFQLGRILEGRSLAKQQS